MNKYIPVISIAPITLIKTGLAYLGRSLAISLARLSKSKVPFASTIPHMPARPSILGI